MPQLQCAGAIRFGPFQVNRQAGELRKHGIKIKLSGQPFEVLTLLLERPGEVVTHEELRAKLWQADTFVDFEHGLHAAVNKLREALGDSAERPRYVETLPRRGYRFVAPVRWVAEAREASAAFPRQRETAPEQIVASASPAQRNWELGRPGATLLGAAAVLVALGFVYSTLRDARKPKVSTAPGIHSVVVLPLENLSRNPEQTDFILLSDFVNATGEAVFDGTLKQALAVKLQESPFFNVVAEQRVRETLRLMGRSPDERVPPPVAREVCERQNIKAMLAGEIAPLGSHYVITLNAVHCRTGDSLAREQAEAASKEEVLRALGKAASDLRGKLGEPLASIQRFDVPIEQATTPSLEALKAFSLGLKVRRDKGDETQVMLLFRRAIELDPNFAMAYGVLGTAYSNLGQEDLAIENIQKAYDLRDRTSEREKYRITVYYYFFCTGQLEKLLETSEQWVLAYPRDYLAHGYLGAALAHLGRYERAAEEYRESFRLESNVVVYEHLISTQLTLGRLDEAEATLREAEQQKPDWAWSHSLRYDLAFLRGDVAGMQREVAWSVNNPEQGVFMLLQQAHAEAFSGHLGRARELLRLWVEQARRASQEEQVRRLLVAEAEWDAEFGNSQRARQQTSAVLPRSSATRPQLVAALTLARAGDATRAQAVAERVSKRFPRDTLINGYWLPTIGAAVELHRGNPGRAIELLEAAIPYELAELDRTGGSHLYPAYLRGEAYLLLHRGTEAVVEFQKLLDHRGLLGVEPLGGLVRLGLARAYALQGDTAKARAAYNDFLTLWKDADPDIPILQQAKAEYAKLK